MNVCYIRMDRAEINKSFDGIKCALVDGDLVECTENLGFFLSL